MIKVDKKLDQIGLLCPMPIINTSKALVDLSEGEVLEVLSDDPGSRSDFEAWSRSTGNKLLSVSEEDGERKVFKFTIRKR